MNPNNSQFQEFSTYFTSDAWQLVSSFLNNLQAKMDQFSVSTEEQTTILHGIEEYILEFIENYKDRAKITFVEALELIQEIGSPSEILHSMDLPFDQTIKPEIITPENDSSTYAKVKCKACEWPNEPDSRFCDHCGVRIGELIEGRKQLRLPRIPDEIIVFPYISGFLLAYLLLIFTGVLTIIITYSSLNYPNLDYIPELYRKLSDTPPDMIIPAFIIGLIIGYLIERFYSGKLTKYRHDVHLTQFQRYFSLGLVLTVIALWLFFIYVPIRVTRDELTTLFIFLTIVCVFFSIWIYKWNSTRKPSDTPYLTILRHIKGLEEDNFRKILTFNLVGDVGIFLLVFIFWSPIMPWNVVAIPAWIVLVISLIILLNGVLLMNYYSWMHINRFIGFTKPFS
ncbi:MAG: zinc ribbon domain-containing protein [Candidatus Heimdallarchaeota archaeon]|nr:MAG: zinc ribbon domain-containing protein [Candidatus Heimdallarchaeota archaeon]